ncbi:uncharacterized protein LOC110030489 [Phalaenopsis equestris]|uniref:uncharacterized protein LOC110030489 n=1 Tax=Phalaenopsis equestris TaxID=78828 RepID=UPI0009E3371B|nr:uncharacterized protein LOC110030489 [Phalaenopsis equestris]
MKERVKLSKRVAEVAGGTTAGCAVVVCCCPCALVNLLVLTVVKLPAFLFRRAVRKRSRAVIKQKMESNVSGLDISASSAGEANIQWQTKAPVAEVLEFENEMLHHFFGNGFWCSPSHRE